jgi:hypothetical protein
MNDRDRQWTAQSAAIAEWGSPRLSIALTVDEVSLLITSYHLIEIKLRQHADGIARMPKSEGLPTLEHDIADSFGTIKNVLYQAGARAQKENAVNKLKLGMVMLGLLLLALLVLPGLTIAARGNALHSSSLPQLVAFLQPEPTEEPSLEPSAEMTAEPGPVVTPVEQIEAAGQLLTQVLLFIGYIAAGGGILMAFGAFLADRRTRMATEKLFLSQPPEAQERLAMLADRVADIADEAVKTLAGISNFLRDVTDGRIEVQRVRMEQGEPLSTELRDAILKSAAQGRVAPIPMYPTGESGQG